MAYDRNDAYYERSRPGAIRCWCKANNEPTYLPRFSHQETLGFKAALDKSPYGSIREIKVVSIVLISNL